MSMRIEDFRTMPNKHMSLNGPSEFDDEEDALPRHPLDSEKALKQLAVLKNWWSEAREKHAENRYQMSIDADFYDGIQWKEEDETVLRERGQEPLVFNKVSQHVNWMLGTERRTRIDFKVLPRGNEDTESANTKTKLLKYVSDVNKSQFARSKAFADTIKVGVGWLESGIRSDPTDEPLFHRSESWRNMWYDWLAKDDDLQDARYLFRVKWVDQDIAEAMFPDRIAEVQAASRADDLFFHDEDEELGYASSFSKFQSEYPIYAAGSTALNDAFDAGNRRSRNKLVECWYRVPVAVKTLRANIDPFTDGELGSQLSQLNGVDFDANSQAQNVLIQEGHISVYDAIKMQVRVAIWTGGSLLQDVESPYKHNRFPFTPIWAYRRDRDGMPYGPVRGMRDPQKDLNKRRSKALFILSTNQLIGDEDAFEDWDEAIDEAARPDGVLKHKRGAQFEINRNIELAEEHVQLMAQDVAFLESASGVTEENLGSVTNTNSGTAINLRQTQGSVVTALLYDNLRAGIQNDGEIELSLIEQFYTEPKQVRIANDRGRAEFLGVNQGMMDEQGQRFVQNDIAATKADFVVDTQDFRENMRMAMFDQLMEMSTRLDPTVTMQILDLIVELSDVQGKDEIVRRIRRINGETDPDDPNREQVEAERDAKGAEDAERDKRAQDADTRKAETTAEKNSADATLKSSEAMRQAMEIIASIKGDPKLARGMDLLMDSLRTPDPSAELAVDPGLTGGAPSQSLDIPNPFDEPEPTGNVNA